MMKSSANRIFKIPSLVNLAQKRFARIAEVGVLERLNEPVKPYKTGQFFLHKVFGYRGAVLFQWSARLFDRDVDGAGGKDAGITGDLQVPKPSTKDLKSENINYYQVLIDSRDAPHIRAQTESVTFLGGQEGSRSIYAIPGLDYASHDDMLPYRTTEKHPMKHELFEKFLLHSPSDNPPYVAQDALKGKGSNIGACFWTHGTKVVPSALGGNPSEGVGIERFKDQPVFIGKVRGSLPPFLEGWEKKNHPWLELSSVHRQTTDNVRVTVIPFYMGTRMNQSNIVYWWRYCIRIENLSSAGVILRERHWRIFSLSGTLETVRGRGAVGQEPVLTKASPAFQYSSHVSLQSPNGHMWGTFRMERQDSYMFDVRIPPFSLESKGDQEPA